MSIKDITIGCSKYLISHTTFICHSFFFAFIILIWNTACSPTSSSSIENDSTQHAALQKIKFDLSEIDENGMLGPPEGKRSIAYEFCIPLHKTKRKEILRIDPSVRFFAGPGGRSGCDEDQYLCIGEGGTREVLLKLASLDYIKKIKPFYGE